MASHNKSLEALIAEYASLSKTAFRVSNLLDWAQEASLQKTKLKDCVQATAGVFYGIAVLSVLARGVIRFTTRRQLALDDYFLFAAFAFLTAVIALVYRLLDSIYLATAVERNPAIFFQFSQKQTQQLLSQALNENIFLVLAWTTTFLVKFSFLAFFRHLIRNVERIQRYYWGIVIFTGITWMFLTSEAFILCSDFGIKASKYYAVLVCPCSMLISPHGSQMLVTDEKYSLRLHDWPYHRPRCDFGYTEYTTWPCLSPVLVTSVLTAQSSREHTRDRALSRTDAHLPENQPRYISMPVPRNGNPGHHPSEQDSWSGIH